MGRGRKGHSQRAKRKSSAEQPTPPHTAPVLRAANPPMAKTPPTSRATRAGHKESGPPTGASRSAAGLDRNQPPASRRAAMASPQARALASGRRRRSMEEG